MNNRIVALLKAPNQPQDPNGTAQILISNNIFRSNKRTEVHLQSNRLNEHLDEIEASEGRFMVDNAQLNIETQMIKQNWEKLGLKIDRTKLVAKIEADSKDNEEKAKDKPFESELIKNYRSLKLFFRLEAYLSRNKRRFINEMKSLRKSSVKALEKQLQDERLKNQQLIRMLGGISNHTSSMEKSLAMKSNDEGKKTIPNRCKTPQEKPFHPALDFDDLLRRSCVWNKSGSSVQLLKAKEPLESIKTSPENLGKKHKKKQSVGRINFERTDFISKYSFRPQSRDSDYSKVSHFRTVDQRSAQLNASSEISGGKGRQIGDSVKTTIQYFKSLARTINSTKPEFPDKPLAASHKERRGSKQGSDLTKQLSGLQFNTKMALHESKPSANSTKPK